MTAVSALRAASYADSSGTLLTEAPLNACVGTATALARTHHDDRNDDRVVVTWLVT